MAFLNIDKIIAPGTLLNTHGPSQVRVPSQRPGRAPGPSLTRPGTLSNNARARACPATPGERERRFLFLFFLFSFSFSFSFHFSFPFPFPFSFSLSLSLGPLVQGSFCMLALFVTVYIRYNTPSQPPSKALFRRLSPLSLLSLRTVAPKHRPPPPPPPSRLASDALLSGTYES